jgi:hypothetical protein
MPTTPPDDPKLGPSPPNQPKQLPRMYKAPGTGRLTFLRDHHLDGTIPTYWGPGQDGPLEDGTYVPPTKWHKHGMVLRVPRVARWFWEAADVETEVVVALGLTGTYDYGIHTNSFDLDIPTPGSIISSHVHSTSLADAGTPQYAIHFTQTLSGSLDLPYIGLIGPATGSVVTWYSQSYLPPFILEEYEDRTSDTYEVVQILWNILSGGFVAPGPLTQDGIPPITFTPDGPTSVGVCFPVKTGIYYINGVEHGERKDPTTLGMVIPEGWAQPKEPASANTASSNWGDLSDKLTAERKYHTNPYFDAFPKAYGIDDFLSLVTPEKDGHFSTHVVNFILLSTPHPVPSALDSRAQRIRECYQHFATYVVVIMLDEQNLSEQSDAGSLEAALFSAQIKAFVASMSDCGWFLETVAYGHPELATEIMDRYIATYLKPELNDAPPNDTPP